MSVSAIDKLDPVIHPKARLGIVTLLAGAESLAFTELKQQLGMTDGNLCVHLRTLEESGYVSVRKSFVNRKPRTEYSLTPLGREALQSYAEAVVEIVKQAQPVEQTRPAAGREARAVLRKGMAPAK